MVTDGKPTVIDVPGEGRYRNTFGSMIASSTARWTRLLVCRRKGITITTFMVTEDPYLRRFVYQLTELNRAGPTSRPRTSSRVRLLDFIRNRKTQMGPRA